MEDQMRDRIELVGMAVGAISGLMQPTINVGGKVPLHVAGHDQVEAAVAIVVHEAGAGAPSAPAHTSLRGNVSKSAVAIVAIKNIPAQVGDQQVDVPVIVVIPDRHSHAVGVALHAGCLGDVGKGAIAIVTIEAVPVTRIGFVRNAPRGMGS
jgi:hypothetical protein